MRYSLDEFSSGGEVVAALQQLKPNGEDLVLQGDNEDTCIIASYDPNSGRYYISTSLPIDADYMEVFDQSRPHCCVQAVIGGQLIDAWDDALVDFEMAKRALLGFFEHQHRHKDCQWRVAKI
jgi:hypothetical protein